MRRSEKIVINTSPLIALVAALGNLKILQSLYTEVWIPYEVCQEILTGGTAKLGMNEFREATWLSKQNQPLNISPLLLNILDQGEASVIQLALNQNIKTVCIDESVGRRIARLSGLSLTRKTWEGWKPRLFRARRKTDPSGFNRLSSFRIHKNNHPFCELIDNIYD